MSDMGIAYRRAFNGTSLSACRLPNLQKSCRDAEKLQVVIKQISKCTNEL